MSVAFIAVHRATILGGSCIWKGTPMATSTKLESGLNIPAMLRSGNALKGLALLLLIAAIGAVLLLAPALRREPEPSPVNLPSMSNIPPAGSLQMQLQPEQPAQ
jgi:hypothetical protein